MTHRDIPWGVLACSSNRVPEASEARPVAEQMTHPKQTPTPGQAAHAEAQRQGVFYARQETWNLIAAAAIEAFLAKQSGELVGDLVHAATEQALTASHMHPATVSPVYESPDVFWPEADRFIGPCVHGRDPWDRCDVCQTVEQAQGLPPTPPTENKDEREHCERLANEIFLLARDEYIEDVVAILLRERAAARAEGWTMRETNTQLLTDAADKAAYERGRAEGEAAEILRRDRTVAELREDRTTLQSKYDRLTAAAREYKLISVCPYTDRGNVADRELQAALAETEEKKT